MTENLIKCETCFLTHDKRVPKLHTCMMQMNCKICNGFHFFFGINKEDYMKFRWECQNCKARYIPLSLRWLPEYYGYAEYEVPEKKDNNFIDKIKKALLG